MRDGYLELIRPVFDVVDIYKGVEPFLRSTKEVPRELLLVYAAHFALSEVHNGGFLQFFWNNTGILSKEAIEGLHMIEMPLLASTFQQAASIFGDPVPRDRDERWDALLAATKLHEEELSGLFQSEENSFLAFRRATAGLGFDVLDKRAWQLMKEEGGGFASSATRFFR